MSDDTPRLPAPTARRRPPLVVEVRDMTNPEDNPALRDAIAKVRRNKYRPRNGRMDFDVFRVFP